MTRFRLISVIFNKSLLYHSFTLSTYSTVFVLMRISSPSFNPKEPMWRACLQGGRFQSGGGITLKPVLYRSLLIRSYREALRPAQSHFLYWSAHPSWLLSGIGERRWCFHCRLSVQMFHCPWSCSPYHLYRGTGSNSVALLSYRVNGITGVPGFSMERLLSTPSV